MATYTRQEIQAAATAYFGPEECPLDDDWTDAEVTRWFRLLPSNHADAIERFADTAAAAICPVHGINHTKYGYPPVNGIDRLACLGTRGDGR